MTHEPDEAEDPAPGIDNDEASKESFPASDPPAGWSGPEAPVPESP